MTKSKQNKDSNGYMQFNKQELRDVNLTRAGRGSEGGREVREGGREVRREEK